MASDFVNVKVYTNYSTPRPEVLENANISLGAIGTIILKKWIVKPEQATM